MALHGATQVSQRFGRYYEQTRRGRMFVVTTAVAGVAPGTALSTTPPMALHNLAAGSPAVDLSIIQVTIGYVSGTLGAGTLVYAQVSDAAAPAGGTVLTPIKTYLGQTENSTATGHQGSTVDATPTIIRPAFVFGAFLATTAAIVAPLVDDVDGSIIVPPGETFVVEGVAAGGATPLILISVMWEEIPRG